MPTCCVVGCSNSSDKDRKKGITFHRFPQKSELKEIWVKVVNRKNWRPSHSSVICSKHFTEAQIDRYSAFKVRIKDNVVPSIFPAIPSHMKKGKKQRSSKSKELAVPTNSDAENSSEETASTDLATSQEGHDEEPGKFVELPSKKFLSDMKELYLKQEDCDVILKVKEQEFPAHRLILKARSPVFASTFKYDTKEKATGVIDIEDCDPSSFSDFLYFLYCGTAEKLSSENVFSLFTAADKYDVQDLRSECMKFMKKNLSIDNFCDTIALALKHSEKELIVLTTDFFRKNLQKIIVTVKWQSFLIENPIQGNELLIKALSLSKT